MAIALEESVQPTLLFIPDISGFTEFVHNTEIQHSGHIIEELLEVLIDANEMDLQISEIEGDAILFYRMGQTPTAAEILAQVQKMYVKFHGHLRKYETHRICQCGACSSAHNLSIKFVLHFGDLMTRQIKSFSKLFGKDLIVAHRLMKNKVDVKEYVLFTHQLLNKCSAWVEMEQAAWDKPVTGEESYDFGPVKYCYLSLEALGVHVPEPRVEDYATPGATAMVMETEKVVNAPIDMVFDIITDVSFRDKWINGVTDTADLNSKIARNGTTHRCVMGAEVDPFFTSHTFDISQSKITWIDTNPDARMDLVITLIKIGNKLTRVTYNAFIKAHFFRKFMFKWKESKPLESWISGNLDNLDQLCKEMQKDGKQHEERIMLNPAS